MALLFIFLISCNPIVNKSSNLTVSAAASLQQVMTEIQQAYIATQPNVRIIYNFGSSGSLQQQIEQGANVDIFISAGTQQMNALADKGLIIADTRKNLLTNQIVLIVPKGNQGISGFQDLASDRITKVAIGEPNSVPVGKYAKEVLTRFKIFEQVENKLIFAKDTRQVLNYVETENVDAGVVYLTDAKSSNLVDIVATASNSFHSPVVYPIAVIKNSKNTIAAKDFIQFLDSKAARSIYNKYGFNKPNVEANK
ncbi:hypothetical protein UH38_08180 [Aliterella atlantica CENA595]|uniref:Molybdate ABC transporter substrate-binding protein n=1 Tax=Aliterella atlantica CENA595 TaxID=1618023 RepID=A0A0D8ZU16_9CYAN|nr:hypothetical protein UH38_08180 [Aliterella atlantica CENA595]